MEARCLLGKAEHLPKKPILFSVKEHENLALITYAMNSYNYNYNNPCDCDYTHSHHSGQAETTHRLSSLWGDKS